MTDVTFSHADTQRLLSLIFGFSSFLSSMKNPSFKNLLTPRHGCRFFFFFFFFFF